MGRQGEEFILNLRALHFSENDWGVTNRKKRTDDHFCDVGIELRSVKAIIEHIRVSICTLTLHGSSDLCVSNTVSEDDSAERQMYSRFRAAESLRGQISAYDEFDCTLHPIRL